MRIIAHRANINGTNKDTENSIEQIELCISKGFDVEIDVWNINNELFLGHDSPTYRIPYNKLLSMSDNLWVHCKNIHALNVLCQDFNAFGHDHDDYVLTSKNFIWVYPNKELCYCCIAVMPELCDYKKDQLTQCYGICTDYPNEFI